MFLSNKCDQRLKAAFELYNQQLSDNLPNKDELKTITFSQTFETKMKKLLAAQKKSYYYMINTVGKRIAIIITALLITLSSSLILALVYYKQYRGFKMASWGLFGRSVYFVTKI